MKWLELKQQLIQKQLPFVSILLVDHQGSSPQDVGARALVTAEGLYWGTVGGGKVELRAIAHAQELLSQKKPHDFVRWNLRADIGMTCGGIVSFFFEVFSPVRDWNIAIFGAGHVAQALVRALIQLKCKIFCIDSRADWLEKLPYDNKLTRIHLKEPSEAVKDLPQNSFIASLTMGHTFDLPVLCAALGNHNFPYVGAIGSNTKALVLKRDLANNNIAQEKINSLFCPIGEAFGSNDPAEIALSIAAQMLKIRGAL